VTVIPGTTISSTEPASPKPKLRWYQFSLRMLLIVVTLFAVAFSWFAVKMGQARRQREAVEAIRQTQSQFQDGMRHYHNAYYSFEIDGDGNPVVDASPSIPNWLVDWLGEDFFYNVNSVTLEVTPKQGLEVLKSFPQLRRVDVAGDIADSDLGNLKGLARLRDLYCSSSHVTDAGVDHLTRNRQLEKLGLDKAKITDLGLAQLAELRQLQSLALCDTKITDDGLKYLPTLNRLKELTLSGLPNVGSGLAHLRRLSNLHSLSLRETRIGVAGWSNLESLNQLESLALSDTDVTDDELMHIRKFSKLKSLDLAYTEIGDAGLGQLRELHQLEFIWLSGTKVTDNGIKDLKVALPNVVIMDR
jgi:hypothetical protein